MEARLELFHRVPASVTEAEHFIRLIQRVEAYSRNVWKIMGSSIIFQLSNPWIITRAGTRKKIMSKLFIRVMHVHAPLMQICLVCII